MKKLFVILSFLISVTCFTTQSWALPLCPTSGVKHNCYGFQTYDIGKYKGEWQNNKQNGKGIYTFFSGSIYEGEFKNNQRNGYGVYIHGPNTK